MPAPIKILVSYIPDNDAIGVILLTDTERANIQDRIAELRTAEETAKADALQEALDLDGQLQAQDNAIHSVFVFKRPSTQDRLLIRHKAYNQAAAQGDVADWIYGMYLRLVSVETLYTGTEDADGKATDGTIPDDLLEHVAGLLDVALMTGKAAADFLSPSADRSPASKA